MESKASWRPRHRDGCNQFAYFYKRRYRWRVVASKRFLGRRPVPCYSGAMHNAWAAAAAAVCFFLVSFSSSTGSRASTGHAPTPDSLIKKPPRFIHGRLNPANVITNVCPLLLRLESYSFRPPRKARRGNFFISEFFHFGFQINSTILMRIVNCRRKKKSIGWRGRKKEGGNFIRKGN